MHVVYAPRMAHAMLHGHTHRHTHTHARDQLLCLLTAAHLARPFHGPLAHEYRKDERSS